jgi:thiol-disulfide isomerase/thioredoxin
MKTAKWMILAVGIMLYALLPLDARNAPGFALFDTNDKLILLSALLKERPVVVSFFASYCLPCKRETPALLELEKKYPGKFTLLLINIDREGKSKALEFLNEVGINRPCLLDMYQETAKKYIPDLKIPAVFLVDKKGNIIFEIIGEKPDSIKKLEEKVKKL